ncbi:MAG TPA: copper homeostasis protein CutC [Chitinophagaceae bacterium]|jgi:copper homeostasis protein
MSFTLEIAVFNISSALSAATAGADRIELCENPVDGGTTPSFGTLKIVREKINIPAFPIIRPRGGDFLYSDEEFDVIKKDVQLIKDLGFEGIVVGLLRKDGTIDTRRTGKLVELAYPMEVTFHRAFDRATEPLHALEEIIICGCQRILTSGQAPNAIDGKELLRQLIERADERIVIMPGSGVRSNNIAELAAYTHAHEFHSSARKVIPSQMKFIQKSMKENVENILVDIEEIKTMKEVLIKFEPSEPA